MERKRPFRLETCFKLGLFGNICFVAFIIICLIYYYTFSPSGTFRLGFDIAAYIVEFAGFGLMALAIAGICCTLQRSFKDRAHASGAPQLVKGSRHAWAHLPRLALLEPTMADR